eukprot:GEMP01000295.1.p1 GENE.GEMP01000295.1~~GEMP01000295.1.p1  ORF type:complete len:1869 (+),score=378.91 GEMP01000295.1:296-5902(+)
MKIKRILVVNRGECALRIFRTCAKMHIATAAIYTEDDCESLHVAGGDIAFTVSDYTNMGDILTVVRSLVERECGPIGVHPGYGFLSESAVFAAMMSDEPSVIWIGPSPRVMEQLGLKDKARQFVKEIGLPINEGSPIVHSAAQAARWVHDNNMDYPVIIKPIGGGGGVGMRIAWTEDDLNDEMTFAKMQDLCTRFFGTEGSGMFVEKYIQDARHIEVQVFGDGQGNAIHLGERECSVQRRHQKVVEESPSPGISPTIRAELCKHARHLAQYIHYESCGTVEFIYDSRSEQFFFLEVNTRLQVEHGVTEMVNGNIDLVEWMIRQADKSEPFDICRTFAWNPSGHCIQVRVYAEDCNSGFRPSPGVLQAFDLPPVESRDSRRDALLRDETKLSATSDITRFETHCSRGFTISEKYDPMIVKILQWGPTRYAAVTRMRHLLKDCTIHGTPNNLPLLQQFIATRIFEEGRTFNTTLEHYVKHHFRSTSFEIVKVGSNVTVQDFPGRTQQGMWRVGIPPSGAFDHLACRLANSLVSNAEDAAVLECLMLGGGTPTTLLFHCNTTVSITGVPCQIRKLTSGTQNMDDGDDRDFFRTLLQYVAFSVSKGEAIELTREKTDAPEGCRVYISIHGGVDVPKYLGSRSTFTPGEFGGYQGRFLRPGDVLQIGAPSCPLTPQQDDDGDDECVAGHVGVVGKMLPRQLWPVYKKNWRIGVLPGPRANPDFMTDEDVCMLHSSEWQVHHDSNRMGIRLIGPKPEWARASGGEGGSHPSNIHDEVYAVGTINFTGDMPIIIAHDGPSLGGFVCPITIVQSELWKIGQVKGGDTITFVLMTLEEATRTKLEQDHFIRTLHQASNLPYPTSIRDHPALWALQDSNIPTRAVIFEKQPTALGHPGMEVRLAGDKHLLVAYGPMVLDLALRMRIHFLENALLDPSVRPDGLEETAPGVRSLQIRYDPIKLPLSRLLELLCWVDDTRVGEDISSKSVSSRVFRLPLAFNSRGCKEATEKYSKSIRDDAPYLPCNIDYVAKNNGLASHDEVYERLFRASYMCLGLGDVYLGACCAVPVDPRDRMITTKMNPARTWTEEGTVGLGGAYMCIYPMDSPGGYQLVGRTLPIWNTWGKNQPSIFSADKPWMLDMFDQIRFYPCDEAELDKMREQFRRGIYVPEMQFEEFHLGEHQMFLDSIEHEVVPYKAQQQAAMEHMNHEEVLSQHRLEATRRQQHCSNHHTEDTDVPCFLGANIGATKNDIPKGHIGVEANLRANVLEIKTQVVPHAVAAGDILLVLEAMKMQIQIVSPVNGVVVEVRASEGQMVDTGSVMVVIKEMTGTPDAFDAISLSSLPSPCKVHESEPFSPSHVNFSPHLDTRGESTQRYSLQIDRLKTMYAQGNITIFDVVDQIFDDIEQWDRENGEDNFGNIWISRASKIEVDAYIKREFHVHGRRFDVSTSPLYGIPFVVKDNIDVAGYITTAACPGYKIVPATRNATCVQKLLDAGAIFIGKTNLDQFAAGLVGTRSPYGECYNSFDKDYISGGSSSGSAVAVSLGFASFSLGTDTAGSGRVPASLNNIIGLKPSYGLISCAGVLPACRSLDCVCVFALTAHNAHACVQVMQGEDAEDPFTRRAPSPVAVCRVPNVIIGSTFGGGARALRVGIPRDDQLQFFGNKQGKRVFDKCVRLLRDTLGAHVDPIDYQPFLDTASLLYDGPWVAERLASLQEVMAGDRAADPSLSVLAITREIILRGDKYSAVDMHRSVYHLQMLRKTIIRSLFNTTTNGIATAGAKGPTIDVLMTPTVGTCYTISEVNANPEQTNSNNGYYTNFMNLLDMAAIAVPCGFVKMDDAKYLPFGVTFSCPAFREDFLVSLASHVQQYTNLPFGRIGER